MKGEGNEWGQKIHHPIGGKADMDKPFYRRVNDREGTR